MTLLGTLTTTSGASQTLSGLTLTSYKLIVVVLYNVSGTVANYIQVKGDAGANAPISKSMGNAVNSIFGLATIDLSNGLSNSISGSGTTATVASAAGEVWTAVTSVTTSVTSLVFSPASGNFDAGSIRIYGVN
jgi:hypothetical protein